VLNSTSRTICAALGSCIDSQCYLSSVFHLWDVVRGDELPILVSADRSVLLLKNSTAILELSSHGALTNEQLKTKLVSSQLGKGMWRLGEVVDSPHESRGSGLVAR